MGDLWVQIFLDWSFIVSLSYLCILYAFILFLSLVAAYEAVTRKAESQVDDYDALLFSRFTIPVSVIVPAYNEEQNIACVVRGLLDFDYPEYEIILVNDGSTDSMMDILKAEYALEPYTRVYRKSLVTKPVRTVFRSKMDARLIVLDKENGGKADALNCGANFARYRYLCCVDGDSTYEPDALLAGMRLIVKDPATVLGATSLVAVGRRLNASTDDDIGLKHVDQDAWTNLQHLEILRAFLNNRLAWSRMGFMLCVSGAFAIWRRDVIHESGGFSSEFSCEDIEMTCRILEKYRREGRPAKILSLPNIVGMTEGPERVSGLVSQRARWQRVILETAWRYRRVLFKPRYGTFGFLGMPYLVMSECIGPFMQVLVVVSLAGGAILGLMNWTQFLALFGIQVFMLGILSSMSLWLNDWTFRYYRLSTLLRLIVLALLDMFWYRPILMYAYAKGVVQFFRGDKQWYRFARNIRPGRGQ